MVANDDDDLFVFFLLFFVYCLGCCSFFGFVLFFLNLILETVTNNESPYTKYRSKYLVSAIHMHCSWSVVTFITIK